MRSYLALALLVAAGCATADRGGGTSDANGKRDSNNQFFDSPNPLIDSPNNTGPDSAMAITVSETSATTLSYGGSIACGSQLTGSTNDNIWYRAYQLSDYSAIGGGLHITAVNVGVQDALNSLAITVKLGSYSGALDGASISTAQISSLGQANITPGNTSGMTGETLNVPLVADIPAGGKFVVQVVAPNMDVDATQRAFYIGTTGASETHPGYWSTSTSACGPSTPETMGAAQATGHLIIDVIGTH